MNSEQRAANMLLWIIIGILIALIFSNINTHMNSGYLYNVNNEWYHVPEQWHEDFLDLIKELKTDPGNKDLLEELEEDYSQNIVNLEGTRSVLFE